MHEELNMINKNQTWSLVNRPSNHHVIGVKWIFKKKLNPDDSVNKFKARLVAKGFNQLPGIDNMETFALVARFDTIRLLLALSTALSWNVYHFDIKSAFPNGVLEEEIFMEQPDGFIQNPNEDKVFKLHKALYGLKQAPRTWYSRMDTYLFKQGLVKSCNEATLYIYSSSTKPSMIVSLYVDDLLVTGGDNIALQRFKEKMHNEFDMTDLDLMSYFLRLKINQSVDGIRLSQKKYISDVLRRFHMEQCKPRVIPLPINGKYSCNKGIKLKDPLIY